MYQKPITYKDFLGNEKTKTYFFNLSRSEIFDTVLNEDDRFKVLIETIANTSDTTKMGALFKELILRSYGEISSDGESFVKSDALREKFLNTAAYDALYIEMITDANAASEFINKTIPVNELQEIISKANVELAKREDAVAAIATIPN